MQRHIRTLNIIGIIISLSVVWCGSEQSVQGQCDWEEVQKLLAFDGIQDDHFGFSVSTDGDVMVVGACYDDDNGSDSGSAYVFRYNGFGQWVEEAKLLASDGDAHDSFGQSVAINGDGIVVGACNDDDNDTDSGSAYVFRYDGVGQWIEEAKLLPSDGAVYDLFGISVSIDGDAITVGVLSDDDNGDDSGSAYVFRYNGSGQWIEETKLLPSDGDSGDEFGSSVSMSSDAIIIGARFDDDNGTNSGSAYVFRYDGLGQWIEEAKLLAFDGAEEDYFGWSVSIDGGAIAVGALGDDDSGDDLGSVYVFRYDGSVWSEEAKLSASDGPEWAFFGHSVSIDSDAIVVGAYLDNDSGPDSGSAYVFRNDGSGQWNEEAKLLTSDGTSEEHFGYSVSSSGDAIVVGAVGDDDNGEFSGSAYVFDLQCLPTLTVSPDPLIAGEDATFTGANLTPDANAYLAYSLSGLGSTFIPPLNITLDLHAPAQAGDTIMSDGNGTAEWVLYVPNAGAGRGVWFQACQYELKTNVVATSIE